MRFAYLFLPCVAATLLASWTRPAVACDPVWPNSYQVSGGDDATPPVLHDASISFRRAVDPESGGADCGDIGGLSAFVDGEDDQTAAIELGISFALVRGTLPFVLPTGVFELSSPTEGKTQFGLGDNGDAYDATIAVSVVDRAGNRSEPVEVNVADDAVGCGCSTPGHSRYHAAAMFIGAAALGVLRLRQRRRGSP